MIETILNGLLPVAFGILLGWLTGRQGLLKHEGAYVVGYSLSASRSPSRCSKERSRRRRRNWEMSGFLCLIFGLMGTYLIALAVGRQIFKHDLRTATMKSWSPPTPTWLILARLFSLRCSDRRVLPLTIVLTHVSNKLDAGTDGRTPGISWFTASPTPSSIRSSGCRSSARS